MSLKLVDIARQVEERFIEVDLSVGKVKIYHVPEPIIWTIKPDWQPEQDEAPTVEMKVAGGATQRRPGKPGDKGYDDWQREQRRYANETDQIQNAARYVYALREVEYPDDLSQPPSSVGFINGAYPGDSPNDVLRKYFWLQATAMAKGSDYSKINNALMELHTEVKAEDVDEVKKNLASTTEASGSD